MAGIADFAQWLLRAHVAGRAGSAQLDMNGRRVVSIGSARARWIGAVAFAVVIFVAAGRAQAARNLLNNGNFERGSGNSVNGWRIDAWILTPGTTNYNWIGAHGGEPAEVELVSYRDNDARWLQTVALGPGWYYISAEARTEGILAARTGANVSVLEDGIQSDDLRGTNAWQRLGLYLKVGAGGADVDVALRLGGYMNLTRGRVFFRDASVVRLDSPPSGATRVYDLGQIRKNEARGPIGRPWTLAATFVFLTAVAVVGWWMLAADSAGV
jgi:hypothetical protein